MTSVDSVESDGVSLFPIDIEDSGVETITEKENCPSITHACMSSLEGLSRMREEEGLLRVLSANLRELDSQEKLSEGIKRINSLIETLWYKKEAYLFCVERLVFKHPDLALEYVDKLEYDWDKVKAYLHIAKYQDDLQVANTLQKAAELFSSFGAQYALPYYDELIARGGDAVAAFFDTICSKVQQRWSWLQPCARDLLALAELEIKLQRPNAKETLIRAHAAVVQNTWKTTEDFLRLLECEIQMDSPLISSTIEEMHHANDYNYSWIRLDVIAFEAKHPSLALNFKKDFEEALALAEDDLDLFDLVEAIAMHQKTAAAEIIERIEDEGLKVMAYLALVKADMQEPQFDIEALEEKFNERLKDALITDPWDLTEIFIEAAEIFGPERYRFLLDEAIVLAQPTIDQLYGQELKEAGKTFMHYLGEAFGITLPHPNQNEDDKDVIPSRFSNIYHGDLSDLFEAFACHNFPETQELLQLFYEKLDEGEDLWGDEILTMIKAEFTLLGV